MTDKTRLESLALFGGAPAFPEQLYVGRPNVGDRETFLRYIGEMLDRRWMTNYGPLVKELEQRLAEYLGVKHCIVNCNGTIALEIAVRAAGLTGEVIVPSFTFVATAHALQWQQVTPVFADIDPATHCIDPRSVEAMITPRTTGIIGVHAWGQPCNIDALSAIARRHNLTLMFDAAHAFGCSYRGEMIGRFGEAEVFSFHATKFFHTLEGGAVTTNNDDLARAIRLMTNFGFSGYDTVVSIGTNAKMNEASAAMGLTLLDRISHLAEANRANHARYRQALSGVPGLRVLTYDGQERQNHQYVVVEVDEATAGVSRDVMVRALHAEGIIARRYFYPGVHQMEPYRTLFPNAGASLPETEGLCRRVMVLPNGTTVGAEQIEAVCAIIRTVVRNGPAVNKRIVECE